MTPARRAKLAIGEIVGARYRIDGTVGKGGFGAVYLASQLDTGVQVALKVLLGNYSSSEVDSKRFRREASLVQRLRHPNVVELYDFGQTDRGTPFIAFELLRGTALGVLLKQAGALPLARAVAIGRDVLSGLEAAHALDIVHRDIKPQNIFLLEGSDRAKVLDFGIAKAVAGEASQATQLTESGQMIGTPQYMAPEQVRGLEIDATTDLYALGLVMAEMLTGERVVKGEALIDIYMSHIAETPLELAPEVVSSPLGAVIERAVAKQPRDRYASAGEMLAALDRACPDIGAARPLGRLGTQPIEIPPPSVAEDSAQVGDLDSTVVISEAQRSVIEAREALDARERALLLRTVDDLAVTSERHDDPPPSSATVVIDMGVRLPAAPAAPPVAATPPGAPFAPVPMGPSPWHVPGPPPRRDDTARTPPWVWLVVVLGVMAAVTAAVILLRDAM